MESIGEFECGDVVDRRNASINRGYGFNSCFATQSFNKQLGASASRASFMR